MIAPWILLFAGTASAGELREPLMEILNGFEHGASAEDLGTLGDGVAAELIEIAADPSVPHSRRGRAVSALGHFPHPPVRSFLDAQLVADDHFLQRKAATALVAAFKDDALSSLEPALEADDVQLRLAAVKAIGTLKTDAARTLLGNRVHKEHNDSVKDALKSALTEVSK